MSVAFHDFDTTPLWMCPVCGRVETCGETWVPSDICGNSGSAHRAFKILNPAAQRLAQNLSDYHAEQRRKTLEQDLSHINEVLNWGPVATQEYRHYAERVNAGYMWNGGFWCNPDGKIYPSDWPERLT